MSLMCPPSEVLKNQDDEFHLNYLSILKSSYDFYLVNFYILDLYLFYYVYCCNFLLILKLLLFKLVSNKLKDINYFYFL